MTPFAFRAHFRKLLAVAVLGAASLAQAAPPPTQYTLVTIGNLGSGSSFPNGINNRGEIVGASSTSISGGFFGNYYHGFVWDAGRMIDAGTPNGPNHYSYLSAINEKGVAVG